MPELPEVETMRRGLAGVVGRRIASVEFPRSRVRPLSIEPAAATIARRIVGHTVAAVVRRGKRIVIELARGEAVARCGRLWLAIEPRMTGLMLVVDPPTEEHVRMVMGFTKGGRGAQPQRLLFWDRRGLGTIRLLDDRGLDAVCGPHKHGPDGLVVNGADLADRLRASRRAVKVALLDQRAVAGIGNIYAAEILFRCGIDPRSPCRRLPRDAWERIADVTRALLAEAVAHEGSSIGDETYRTADNRVGRFQRQHRVYGHEGDACTACGGAILRIVQAQRATFFCPGCQRRPGRGAAGSARRGLASRRPTT
ncbi:MAG: bifunctional DNA-formamidopyrimidine glycosylase/DNA-(apurinic or apyrimidinic site) lyase [Planctomycetia bacterium]|nr:bifunctional DNA-formamidopyrimidine glycosylase/DNA-(apurinic or apyrimidinic site) lyase [Planctomycetia bacterium]